MPELLPLLFLFAFGLPLPLGIAAYVVANGWRIRGADPGAPSLLFARRLGLVGLAICIVIGAASVLVPLAGIGSAAGNTAVVVLMVLACAGVSLGAAGLAQRRAMWAGVLAVVFGLVGWLAGGIVLFLSNVGMGMPGRPLRFRGVPILPRVRRGGPRMDGRGGGARIIGLTTETRRALARAWEEDARYEAASVPAFEHLARDLEGAGAPEALVAWARRAAEDEVGHAALCFELASSYAGVTLGASPLLFAHSWTRRDEARHDRLERIAVDSLVDGCVGEGAAARGAALGAERASDPVVKKVLERIAREEETHAELAWAILGWLLGQEPRLAPLLFVRLERLAIETDDDARERAPSGDLACHGRLSPPERKAHLARASSLLSVNIQFYY